MPVFVLGGGGGPDLESITATRNDVKIGKTFINKNGDTVVGILDQSDATVTSSQLISGVIAYNNFNKVTGTIINYADVLNADDATSSDYPNEPINRSQYTAYGTYGKNSPSLKLMFRPKAGYYPTAGYIYETAANVASKISLTASKIATGNTVLGIAGTYKGLGNATASQVLQGRTFSTSSLSNATGTMVNRPLYQTLSNVATGGTHGLTTYIRFPPGAYINQSGSYTEITGSSYTFAKAYYDNRNGVLTSNLIIRDEGFGDQGTLRQPSWVYCTDRTTTWNGTTMRYSLIPCWLGDNYISWTY
jgi:hypothetical protein